MTELEHVNYTVSDPDKTAAFLCEVFGWKIRWQGGSKYDGKTIHVGTDDSYVAIYNTENSPDGESYGQIAGLNHIAVTVDDLDAAEARILAAGFKTENHGDYEPGRRFYFRDHDNIEYEIVSYASKSDIPSLSGGIDHIHVYVPDRGKAATWYAETLGFTPVKGFEHWAEDMSGPLTIADAGNRIHLALFARPKPQKVSIAFGATANEYKAWKAHFAKLSIDVREANHGKAHSIYTEDPWGNQIEVTTYEVSGLN